jgi:hypothetical protein
MPSDVCLDGCAVCKQYLPGNAAMSLSISSSSLSGFSSARSADDQKAMFCCRLSELACSTQSLSIYPNELWTVSFQWYALHCRDKA